MTEAVRVAHVISGLHVGGAERAVERISCGLAPRGIEPVLFSLSDVGEIGSSLRSAGIEVQAMGIRTSRPDPRRLRALRRSIRATEPDVIQTWLYHGDLIGGVAAKGLAPVAWNLRQSALDPDAPWTTNGAAKVCAKLSRRIPARIVSNSEAGARFHAGLGYDADRMVVIPNGVDTTRFRPDAEARAAFRAGIGAGDDEVVVISVGRLDPAKDHRTMVAAVARARALGAPVRLVLCGKGCDGSDPLMGWLADAGIAEHTVLLGIRSDLPDVLAGGDVYLQSSRSEGMPNAVAEGMACALPVVATDVGDTRPLVGGTGWLVAAGDDAALASAVVEAASLASAERRQRGEAARARVADRYSYAAELDRYEALYRMLAGERE